MTALIWKPVTAPDGQVAGWIARDFSAPGTWRRKDHRGRHLGPIVRGGRPTAARTLLDRYRAAKSGQLDPEAVAAHVNTVARRIVWIAAHGTPDDSADLALLLSVLPAAAGERVHTEYERLTAPVDDKSLRVALAALAGHEQKEKTDD